MRGERSRGLSVPTSDGTQEMEIHRAIERRIGAIDFAAIARRAIDDGIARVQGRIL